MNGLLKIILSLSFSGALLILVFLLCKPMIKDRFSKRWQYYIWLIAVFRLLFPFALETNLVGSLFQQFDQNAVQQDTSPQQEQAFQASPETGISDQNNIPGQVGPADENQEERNQTAEPGILETIKQNSTAVCLLVWLVAAVGLFIRKITIYQSFVKYMKAGRIEITDIQLWERAGKLIEKAGIKKTVGLYTNSLIASPLLIGFFRPCIMLPTAELSESDFENTILHELTHFKRRDMFYKWLVQITICLHWFNPLVYIMGREINRNCELSCDEAVIQSLNEERRRGYGDTLLRAMDMGGSYKDSCASVTLYESKELLKERLGAIMKFKKTTRLTAAISVALALVLSFGATVAGAYTSPKQQPKESVKATESQENNQNPNIITVPVDIDTVKDGTYVWLGEYALSNGDKIYYDVSAEKGDQLKTGFAAPGEDPVNTVYFTISNKRQNGTLHNKGGFTVPDFSTPGQYRLFVHTAEGDLTNVKGSVTIEKAQQPANSAVNPSLTLNISSAAVTLEQSADHKISADYNENVYRVDISDQGSDWKVDISSKKISNTNTETIKLYIPDAAYRDIIMNVESSNFTSSIIKSGNIFGNFNTASVLLTLPKGFQGSLDATADSGYFELVSNDDFINTKTTVIDSGELGEVYVPDQFVQDGNSFSYTNGTKSNIIKITRKGTGVVSLYEADDSEPESTFLGKIWGSIWDDKWWQSWNNGWQSNFNNAFQNKEKDIIDIAASGRYQLSIGQGKNQSFGYSEIMKKAFQFTQGQKVKITAERITDFQGGGSYSVKLIFRDSENHVIEMEIGASETKEIAIENAGVYDLTIQNDEDISLNYSIVLEKG